MKHIHFDVESDGFYGAYWACKDGSSCAVIAMLGDDPEDYMARSAVKWLIRLGVNVLTMSPGKKDYGHHNYPLECIEKAVAWLKLHGNEKIGIAGASTAPHVLSNTLSRLTLHQMRHLCADEKAGAI